METTTFARPELLQVAETVARDKGIDRDEVLEAMEQAVQKAGRSKYGQEYDIRAEIDRRNGEIRLLRFREVVETIENEATQIALEAAQRLNTEAEIGDFITDPLPPIDFGAARRRRSDRRSLYARSQLARDRSAAGPPRGL